MGRMGSLLGTFVNFGGFSPLDITGCKLWLDAADIATITKDGSNFVSQWNDKSAEGNNVAQGTGTNQPLWMDAVRNGKPIIRFDGVDNYISRATFTGGDITTSIIIFMVSTNVSTGTARYWFDSADATKRVTYLEDTSAYRLIAAADISGGTIVGGDWHYKRLLSNATETKIFVDASQVATGAGGTPNMKGVTLGARYNTINFGNYDLAEILVYNAVLTSQNITDVETYLKNKWGF